MMAKEYNETTNKLTNKDLKKLGLGRCSTRQDLPLKKCRVIVSGWSILPGLEKIHGKR